MNISPVSFGRTANYSPRFGVEEVQKIFSGVIGNGVPVVGHVSTEQGTQNVDLFLTDREIGTINVAMQKRPNETDWQAAGSTRLIDSFNQTLRTGQPLTQDFSQAGINSVGNAAVEQAQGQNSQSVSLPWFGPRRTGS